MKIERSISSGQSEDLKRTAQRWTRLVGWPTALTSFVLFTCYFQIRDSIVDNSDLANTANNGPYKIQAIFNILNCKLN